jgi:cyclopropane-fatty-acyl-phospholipid synthase
MHLLQTSLAKNLFLKSLSGLRAGLLELISGSETWEFGDRESTLRATVVVHNERFFRRAVVGGDVAIGEAWMDGDWSSPDLVSEVRVAVRNVAQLDGSNRWLSALGRWSDRLLHRTRGNTET